MDFKSKHQVGAEVKDRISALPDAVLCHILSSLQTKLAVRTGILSPRWKKIWVSVPYLDFNDRDFKDSASYSTFVERVLFFRSSSDIQKFLLHCSKDEDYSRICSWILTAIRHNVMELDLHVAPHGSQIFELPSSLFVCKTLTILKLMSPFITNTPASGCFPSLKCLLVTVDLPKDNESMLKLFTKCPVLEELTIQGTLQADIVLNVNISAPRLKILRVKFGSNDDREASNFLVDVPMLECFDLREDFLSNYILSSGNSLVRAILDLYDPMSSVDPDFPTRVSGLLSGVCCLPAFNNLTKLKLVLLECFPWELLTRMLERSPHLKNLVLEHSLTSCDDDDSFDDDSEYDSEPEEPPKPQWHPPQAVPICLVSHLETVSIEGFKGQVDAMEVAKYILMNGAVLKKMMISKAHLCEEIKALCEELLTVPRISKACTLEFI
ncbi:F-box/LRR-repeat protein 13-like [Argentina anserina]|uniref:F-box/LRR-repeat protein 13-like n=1 Tax=Argentina anserina TaxID=57926 RepID=UPI0021765BA6|nr:F-box/LRR-repeat protein 13-like [Potentilla anserina]